MKASIISDASSFFKKENSSNNSSGQYSSFTENQYIGMVVAPLICESAPEIMPELMERVEKRMKELGAVIIKEMDDGSDLDATLMRFNLPVVFDSHTNLDGIIWAQVAQRISRSEDAMCRWEVVSNNKEECARLNGEVKKITDEYVKAGLAKY